MIWVVIFGLAMLVSAYYILALLYHWFKYGATFPLVWFALPVYLIGSGFFTLVALIALASLLS